MGPRTKRAFIIGILFIVFASGYKPMLLLIFGKETDGIVVDIIKSGGGRTSRGMPRASQNYPVVQFSFDAYKRMVFVGSMDIDKKIHVGQNKKILFLPFYPQLAEINSFHSLYDGFLIKVIISLLVWVAFMTSFNDIFDKKQIPDNSEESESDPSSPRLT